MQETATNPPPAPPKRPGLSREVKRGILRLVAVLLVIVMVIGGWFIYSSSLQKKATSATVERGLLNASYAGSALIVRNETPFSAEGVTSIEYTADEGTVVSRGMSICNVFSSGYSTREMSTLQNYRNQIRDYQLTQLASGSIKDNRVTRIENELLTTAKQVREAVASGNGNLINLEKSLTAVITARQEILSDIFADEQRLTRLYDDQRAQQQRIDSWTKPYIAASTALVSFYSDGYEYGITGSNYQDFTPSEVRSMINGNKPEKSLSVSKSKTTIYRTIEDGTWYVLFLVDDTSWLPVEDETYTLTLEHFENTQVDAHVESITRSSGELLLRLRVTSSVEPVLYMRSCQATLGDAVSTYMVPKSALYSQDGNDGVVIEVDGNSYFVNVQVKYQDKENIFITPITAGQLYEGQTVKLFN